MTDRTYIATRALQGLLSHGECNGYHGCDLVQTSPEAFAERAVMYADALLEKLAFKPPSSSPVEKEKVRCDASCQHADPFGPWPHETKLEEDAGDVHTDDCIEVCQEHGDDDFQHCTSGRPASKCRVRTPAEEGARRAREIAENVEGKPL